MTLCWYFVHPQSTALGADVPKKIRERLSFKLFREAEPVRQVRLSGSTGQVALELDLEATTLRDRSGRRRTSFPEQPEPNPKSAKSSCYCPESTARGSPMPRPMGSWSLGGTRGLGREPVAKHSEKQGRDP